MIDFHSHILPRMDDGAADLAVSFGMLRTSFRQGVDVMVSTSHYYADEEYPDVFLERRNHRLALLEERMLLLPEVFPFIIPGAEVLYFPGISSAEDVAKLTIGKTRLILIEPPMVPWRDAMLDEIADLQQTQHCLPVIAHVDRFMRMLDDDTLVDRVLERQMLVQVNAEYFTDSKTVRGALQNLKDGKIHFVGSDCHDLEERAPNMRDARRIITANHLEAEFKKLTLNAAKTLGVEGKVL